MNTFLKVLLIAIAVVVAIKLLPVAFGVAALLAGGVIAIGAAGISAAVVLTCAALLIVALLSPVWLPVLAIVGVVALARRSRTRAA